MRESSLLVLKALVKEPQSFSRLVQNLHLAPSTVSDALDELQFFGLVQRDRIVSLSKAPVSNSLKQLAGKYNLDALFRGRKLSILLALFFPKSLPRLALEANVSESRLVVLLSELTAIGAISESAGNFSLNEGVADFVGELKKSMDSLRVEPNAILLFSDGFKLKKAPLEARLQGAKTAFSVFPEFGIDYASLYSYWIEPAHELAAGEVFVHALIASETKKELALCVLFFLKNREKMPVKIVKEFARQFNALGLFLDCLAFLDRREPKSRGFLPWIEFEGLASLYGIGLEMYKRYGLPMVEELFAGIGKALDCNLEVFLIGGGNLAFKNIKGTTKDIDIIVREKSDFEILSQTLARMGFKQSLLSDGSTPSGIFVKEGFPRIDCFTKTVMRFLSLTESLAERAALKNYGRLSVWLPSLEAVILFKSITEREGDLEDIAAILKKESIDWNFLIKELERQQSTMDQLLCLNALDTLEAIEERENIRIPIKKKLLKLCLESAVLFLCESPKTVKEIKAKLDFPEYAVRNMLSKLAKKGKIIKAKENPAQFVVAGSKQAETGQTARPKKGAGMG